jgi:hypothetical protein
MRESVPAFESRSLCLAVQPEVRYRHVRDQMFLSSSRDQLSVQIQRCRR